MSRRVAVVTGASRGIGRVLTERLAAAGHTVVAVARSAEHLKEVAAATGALPYVLDVGDPAAVPEVFARIAEEVGVPDLLVNNAGIAGPIGPTGAADPDLWWEVFEVNVRGTFLCTRAVLPAMTDRGSGRIVNMSSGAALYPVGLDANDVINSAYMASKAAVIRFSEAVAGECHAQGICVFSMSPGMVKTDMTAGAFSDLWDDPDVWSPVDKAVDLVLDLDAGRLDELTGRYFRAAIDDWRALADHAPEVVAADGQSMRLTPPLP